RVDPSCDDRELPRRRGGCLSICCSSAEKRRYRHCKRREEQALLHCESPLAKSGACQPVSCFLPSPTSVPMMSSAAAFDRHPPSPSRRRVTPPDCDTAAATRGHGPACLQEPRWRRKWL